MEVFIGAEKRRLRVETIFQELSEEQGGLLILLPGLVEPLLEVEVLLLEALVFLLLH